MIETLVVRWGYLAVGIGTLLEGETVLLVAGAMAHRGLLSLPLVIATAFAGSVIGDLIWFSIGRRYGRAFIAARPHLQTHAERVERRIKRSGTPFVLGFRFLYGLRTVTPVLLGASNYPLMRFIALNAVGGALWAVSFGLGGFAVGASVTSALGHATRPEEALLVAGVMAIGLWLLVRRRARQR